MQVNIFLTREIGKAKFYQFNTKSNLKLSRSQCEEKNWTTTFILMPNLEGKLQRRSVYKVHNIFSSRYQQQLQNSPSIELPHFSGMQKCFGWSWWHDLIQNFIFYWTMYSTLAIFTKKLSFLAVISTIYFGINMLLSHLKQCCLIQKPHCNRL